MSRNVSFLGPHTILAPRILEIDTDEADADELSSLKANVLRAQVWGAERHVQITSTCTAI